VVEMCQWDRSVSAHVPAAYRVSRFRCA